LDGLLTLEAAPDSFEVHLRIPLAALKSELNLG